MPLDLLLEGYPLPDGDPARWDPAAQVLAALTSAPESSELAGEAQALAAFRARGADAEPPSRVRRRGPGRLALLRGTRPAVAAVTGAVFMGGLLAVAYAGDLPGAAQRLAHDTIDAPAGGPAATGQEQGVAPGSASLRPAGSGPAVPSSRPGAATPDHHAAHGSRAGSPYHHRPSGSAPGTERGLPTGHPEQSGRPSDSPATGPAQQPSPSASNPPTAGPTPSPSAAPSATRRSAPRYGPPPSAAAPGAPP